MSQQEEHKGKRQTFTSWKMDMLDAMSYDLDVTDADFRVAFRVIQHLNSVSGLAWPSIARLAAQLGKSEDRVRASTKRLSTVGWIWKGRKSQKAPNEYRFLEDRVNMVLDAMLQRMDKVSSANDRADMRGQKSVDHAHLRGGDHAEMHGPDHANLHGKHPKQNYLQLTPSYLGASNEELPVQSLWNFESDLDVAWPIPDSEDIGRQILNDVAGHLKPLIKDHLVKRLMSGNLTPGFLIDRLTAHEREQTQKEAS